MAARPWGIRYPVREFFDEERQVHESISRRRLLQSGAAIAAWPSPATAKGSLAAAARRNGRSYGAAARLDHLRKDRAFAATVAAECAQLTPEVELKWAALEPARGQLSLAAMDDLAAWARQHGKSVHGHTLVWHRSIAPWAIEALRDEPDWGIVHRYFASVMPRYGDVIDTWDVVNEPLASDDGQDGLRPSPFLAVFGPDYLRRALDSARIFAPRAKLLINEFGFETDHPRDAAKRKRFLRLVDDLRKMGAPLNGVGLQAHLDLGHGRLSQTALEAFLAELAARGLILMVTELDVKEADYAAPVERRDAAVAAIARTYLDVALAQPAVRGVTTWGLSDRYSWLEVTPADLARHSAAWDDGSGPGVNRGLPLDAALRPKPLHKAMLDAFAAAPKTTV